VLEDSTDAVEIVGGSLFPAIAAFLPAADGKKTGRRNRPGRSKLG
jgi:hypothetical protein